MVCSKKKSDDVRKEMNSALKDIKKLISNVSKVVKRDFGKIRVKYKEQIISNAVKYKLTKYFIYEVLRKSRF